MDWHYLAGFFDGEGYVGFDLCGGRGVGISPEVSIVQADPMGFQVLSEISEFLLKNGIKSTLRFRSYTRTGKRTFFLRVRSRDGSVRFLVGVFPFLRVKKVKAQDMIRFCKTFPPLTLYLSEVRTGMKNKRSQILRTA